jgi:hypothetical protein
VLLAPPERRRRGVVGQGRHVAAHDLEQLADLTARGPVDEADQPAGPADARELLRDDLLARRELDAERGEHAVDALVIEREVLGVALDPVDGHPVFRGPPARGPEQLRGEVEADDLRARGGGPDRDVPRSGRDVDHLQARRHLHAGEEVARRRLVDELGDGGVIARGPGRPVCALEVGNKSHAGEHPPRRRLAHREKSLRAAYPAGATPSARAV